MRFAASGTVNTWGGPDGQRDHVCGDVKCPLRGEPYGALIGRIGERGEIFKVGSNRELTAAEAGELFLTVNDWECQDNSGNFTVTITLE